MILNLYVPAEGTNAASSIKKGSAIVSDPHDTSGGAGYIIVHYEGNLPGAENSLTYKQLAEIAAGRLVSKSKSSPDAMMASPVVEFVQVGTFDYSTKKLSVWGISEGVLAKWKMNR